MGRAHRSWVGPAAAAGAVLRRPGLHLAAPPPRRRRRRLQEVPTSVEREYYGECSASTRQGISPGWADVYSYELDGQTLVYPRRLGDGRLLCLDLRADPRRRIIESDETDNASSIGLRIRGDRVTKVVTPRCSAAPTS